MRSRLIQARKRKGYTQKKLADLVGVKRPTVSRWESGIDEPSPYYVPLIFEVLGSEDNDLLENIEPDKQESQPCVTTSVGDKLDSSEVSFQQEEEESEEMKRREATNIIVTSAIAATTIPTIPLVNTTQLVLNPLVDAYLNTCETSLGTWWHWYNTGNYAELENALSINVPMLKGIATFQQTTVSPYQRHAATIAVQAMIIQQSLATHNLKYLQREKICYDAVQLGELSGDKNLHALAQFWYGDTFTYCYQKPNIAIHHLNDALSNVDDSPLIAMRIYSDLSIAHAQNHDETSSLDCIELAYSTMPSQPVLDNRLHTIGHAELDQKVGKAYLYLAELLSNRSYALQARDLFKKSVSQAINNGYGYLMQAIIRQADAYRVLGDKDMCITCLTKAYKEGPSVLRLNQIDDVLHRVPDNWQTETAVQELQKEVANKLVVARP